MTVSDNTVQAEGLNDFFMNLGEKGLNGSQRWQKSYWKTQDERWKEEQTLVELLHPEVPKQLYQAYLKW